MTHPVIPPFIDDLRDFAQVVQEGLASYDNIPLLHEMSQTPAGQTFLDQMASLWMQYELSNAALNGAGEERIKQIAKEELSDIYNQLAMTVNSLSLTDQKSLRLGEVYTKAYRNIVNAIGGQLTPLQLNEANKKAFIQSLIIEAEHRMADRIMTLFIKLQTQKDELNFYLQQREARQEQAEIVAMAAVDLGLLQQAQIIELLERYELNLQAQNDYYHSFYDSLSAQGVATTVKMKECQDKIVACQKERAELEEALVPFKEELAKLNIREDEVQEQLVQLNEEQNQDLQLQEDLEQQLIGDINQQMIDQQELYLSQEDDMPIYGPPTRHAAKQHDIKIEIKAAKKEMEASKGQRKQVNDLSSQLKVMLAAGSLSFRELKAYSDMTRNLCERYPDDPSFIKYKQMADEMIVSSMGTPKAKAHLHAMDLLSDDQNHDSFVITPDHAYILMSQMKDRAKAAKDLGQQFALVKNKEGQFVVAPKDCLDENRDIKEGWFDDKGQEDYQAWEVEARHMLEAFGHEESALGMPPEDFIKLHIGALQYQEDLYAADRARYQIQQEREKHNKDPIQFPNNPSDEDIARLQAAYKAMAEDPSKYLARVTADSAYTSIGASIKGNQAAADLADELAKDKKALDSIKDKYADLTEALFKENQKDLLENMKDIYDECLSTLEVIRDRINTSEQQKAALTQELMQVQNLTEGVQGQVDALEARIVQINATEADEKKLLALYEKELDYVNQLSEGCEEHQRLNDEILQAIQTYKETPSQDVKNLIDKLKQDKTELEIKMNKIGELYTTLQKETASLAANNIYRTEMSRPAPLQFSSLKSESPKKRKNDAVVAFGYEHARASDPLHSKVEHRQGTNPNPEAELGVRSRDKNNNRI